MTMQKSCYERNISMGKKMNRLMKLLLSSLFIMLFLFGTNTFAGKTIDRPGSDNSDSTNLVVIKGKIRSIDLYKMEIILEGCALLGIKPLKLSEGTTYYLGTDEDNINSIKGGTQFSEKDKINFYDLEVGHTIKCNYEIINGEFWALRVIRVFQQVQHTLFNGTCPNGTCQNAHWAGGRVESCRGRNG